MTENRRVIMTKRLLKESIFELMKNKPLSKITIKEICENADVNRTTFYKYYGDQYSLVKEAEDELLAKTSEFLRNLSSDEEKIKLLEEFLTYVKNNGEMFDILLDRNSDTDFRIRLMSVAMEKVMIEKYEPSIRDDNKKYVYCMVIMGAISTMSLWIKSNYDKSIKDVADLMYNLVLYGLKGIEDKNI
mgnify:CR=1 FL=1